MRDSVQRFTDRVDDYQVYRPGYPAEVLRTLVDECALAPGAAVADVGSGTGKLSERLLSAGLRVYAVEPNQAMRASAEASLGGRPEFQSIAGNAEATTLAPASVDLITAAQAFHWFDQRRARAEFARILRPRGFVALIWNERRHDTQFQRDYEQIVRTFGTDYATLADRGLTSETLARFFAPGKMRLLEHSNRQVFDWDGLVGRLMSCSYAPKPGQPNHEPMMAALQASFAKGQKDGKVTLDYATQIYLGRLT